MNVGQILETHLGWAAQILGFEAKTPVFQGASEDEVGALLKIAGISWARSALLSRPSEPALDADEITDLLGVSAHVRWPPDHGVHQDQGGWERGGPPRTWG